MRDLFFIGYLGLLMLLAFKRPFLFTLVYAYVDIVAPQNMSYYLLNAIPISLICFGLALLGFLISDDKQNVRVTPRWALLIILLVYCFYTTNTADLPIDAKEKWDWVWKALIFAIFLPLTLHTRLRIEALALTTVLCASALIVTGGIKTSIGGGGYGVLKLLVDSNSGLYEGSIISTVAIAIIPLVLWLGKFGTIFAPDWRVRLYVAALVFACMLIPIGTQARTGLVCIAVLAVLMLRFAKNRFLYVLAAVSVAFVSIPFLPESFTKRMNTIQTYEKDESASTRIAVWTWTLEYVQEHPLGGGFNAYRQNKLRYELDIIDENGMSTGDTETGQKDIVDAGRAYHSSYFEMLGEQGWPGLIIWLIIHIGGIWRMEVIQRIYKKRNRPDEAWVQPLALALQNAQIIYMIGCLFVGIAFQPFVYMLVAMQIGLDTYLSRRRNEAVWRPLTKQRLSQNTTDITKSV